MTNKYLIFSLIASASLCGCYKNNISNKTDSSADHTNQTAPTDNIASEDSTPPKTSQDDSYIQNIIDQKELDQIKAIDDQYKNFKIEYEAPSAPTCPKTAKSNLECYPNAKHPVCIYTDEQIDYHITLCPCGDQNIINGTECINEKPACNGKILKSTLPGFGCDENGQYVCRQSWGCDIGSQHCKYSQTFENGKCISTVQKEIDGICLEGNCPCGDGACALGAQCVNDTCVCGEDMDEWVEDTSLIVPGFKESAKGNSFGDFVCRGVKYCGTSACSMEYQFVCTNPNGCHSGTRHFNAGYYATKEFSKQLAVFHYDGAIEPGDEFGYSCIVPTNNGHCDMDFEMRNADWRIPIEHRSYNHTLCKGGIQLCHAKGQKPAQIPENADKYAYGCRTVWPHGPMAWKCEIVPCTCGNTQCPMDSFCVDGQCVTANDYRVQYDDDHTEICDDGRGNKEIVPAESNGWACIESVFTTDDMIKAWTCQHTTCLCNGEICTKDMICSNEKCISPAEHPESVPPTKRWHTVYSYTKDPTKLEQCGRQSAENVAQRTDWTDKSIQILGIAKPETDRCRVRQNCDTWGVPRNNRNQYVCDHGLYLQKDINGKIAAADRPLGLRCIDPDGCVCHDTKCPTNSLCIDYNSSCVFDSLYNDLTNTDHKTDWSNPESVYEFWRQYKIDYVPFVVPSSRTINGKTWLL